MPDVNWIAVLLCGLSSMLLGGLWYSPLLFGRVWQRSAGLADVNLAGRGMAMIPGTAFLLSLIAAAMFAMFLGGEMGLGPSVAAGAAAAFGINYLFERRSLVHWLVNGGYHTLQFTLFGLILGLLA